MDAEANRNLPAQARFLVAVSLLNPEVLRSLRILSDVSIHLPQPHELRNWARRWNLATDWVIDWADHTVRWQRHGPSRRWNQFHHPRWTLRSRYERKPGTINEVLQRRIPDINFGDWIGNPATRSLARKHVTQALQHIVRESFNEIEASASSAGLFEARKRRSRGHTKISLAPERSEVRSFCGLAGYQTLGWSRGRIAEAVGVERNAVGMAIRDLAADLKMDLRADRPYDKSKTIELIRRELEAARAEEEASELLLKE